MAPTDWYCEEVLSCRTIDRADRLMPAPNAGFKRLEALAKECYAGDPAVIAAVMPVIASGT